MIDSYVSTILAQLVERTRTLKGSIPTRNLSKEYYPLVERCRRLTDDIITRIERLKDDKRYLLRSNHPQRFRVLQRIVEDLDTLETIAISALVKVDDEDDRLNELLSRICAEIRYPLIPPVVTTLSQSYYHIYCGLDLLCVPLHESRFLLHLPDLYHELGHPLLVEANNPQTEALANSSVLALGLAIEYLNDQLVLEKRSRLSGYPQFLIKKWIRFWPAWIIEFFCDLFGAFTLGPAFVWSHLHLVATRGGDPFFCEEEDHPSHAARMNVMLHGLRLVGFLNESERIRKSWDELLRGMRAEPENTHLRCYPDRLLERISALALEGISAIGCRIAGRDERGVVQDLLNEAWDRFWREPQSYVEWERGAVRSLYSTTTARMSD